MFPQIHALPGTQRTTPVAHRNRQVGVCQNASDMGWHVVRAFRRVRKHRIPIGSQSRHERFEVTTNIRVRIFAHHQRGAGVADENLAKPAADTRMTHKILDITRDVMCSPSAGANCELSLGDHGS